MLNFETKRKCMLNSEELIEKLFAYYRVSNVSELSRVIDSSQAVISNWKIRNSINAIKKKCRELGIYNEIFGDLNTSFTQHGSGNQQIGTQNNPDGSNINNFGSPKTQNIDEDILKLVEALSSVANALNKKQELKQELTKLISTLPTL